MATFINKKIISEKNFSERLKAARRKKHLTLSQAEEETKVRVKYLEALEDGNFADLPADVYSVGFLVKYAEFLNLDKEEILASYRRERGYQKNFEKIVPQAGLKDKKAYLTPRVVVLTLVFLSIVVFLGYIFYAVRNFTSPPNLVISSPVNDSIVHQERVEVTGKTDEGSSLQINNQTVFLDDNGNFHENVKLQPGLNNIELKATNRVKKETIKVIKILAEY